MTKALDYFVTVPKGMVGLLVAELRELGIEQTHEKKSGVAFSGPIEAAYRVCLWSRLANRVLLCLDQFDCTTPELLYRSVNAIDWASHLEPDATLAVDFVGTNATIRHSHFGALKVKDAIVDQMREYCGHRPSIALDRPDLRINVHLDKGIASVYVDLSGDSLHKRNYRVEGGKAPLKENLAAAILIKAGWPALSEQGQEFVDPMCGSGTLVIEAAMMAGDIAPGILRDYFGFQGWKQHKPEVWDGLLRDAEQRRDLGLSTLPPISGYDIDHRVLAIAEVNIERAGLLEHIRIERRPIVDTRPRNSSAARGLVAVNPPYGERIGQTDELYALYTDLGSVLREYFSGWNAALLTANSELGFRLGIRSRRPATLYNGAIECKLLNFEITPKRFFIPKEISVGEPSTNVATVDVMAAARCLGESGQAKAEMFSNRLKKNLRNIGRWANRNGISCYRLYDADLPEYALAIDVYGEENRWIHVQEYRAPASIDPEKARTRLVDGLSVLPGVLDVSWDHVFLKTRQRQKGNSQYEKQVNLGRLVEVQESGCRFLVNFESYLDTGLFLDHRITRQMIADLATDKHFLNLFGYTGTASVFAATCGALSTATVDLSKTYLDWARRNFKLNGISDKSNSLVQADCLEWIEKATAKSSKRYGLIFLDPPTFSNSKSMADTFDVQRDHVDLLNKTFKLLDKQGVLIFSTNCRKFKLDSGSLNGVSIHDLNHKTLPRDFARNPHIHSCWKMTRI